ncbi:hypothetical protein BGX21_007929, partial [Mortierella sp. AD011]
RALQRARRKPVLTTATPESGAFRNVTVPQVIPCNCSRGGGAVALSELPSHTDRTAATPQETEL